jgi:hypothetical protein
MKYQRVSVSLSKTVQFSTFLFESDKFRKATISFFLFVRPSVRTEQLGPHWKDFFEIQYLWIFEISVEKIKV